MKKHLIAIAALACLLLAGCNTVHGIGQDVKGAGNAISRAAK